MILARDEPFRRCSSAICAGVYAAPDYFEIDPLESITTSWMRSASCVTILATSYLIFLMAPLFACFVRSVPSVLELDDLEDMFFSKF